MDAPERSEAAAAGFPDDPLVEILSRVHAKPLFRFKCVSKGWCDLIASRLRGNKSRQTLEGFFFGSGGSDDNFGSFASLSGRPAPFVDPTFSFLKKIPGIKDLVHWSSHNGLLLFRHLRDCGTYGYIVCNPATEQWVAVPSSGWTVSPLLKKQGGYQDDFTRDAHHFLIFDPAISSHFHLVEVGYYRGPKVVKAVLIYSSETGVWTNNTKAWMQYGERWSGATDIVKTKLGSAYLNGRLHVLIYTCYHLQTIKDQIVAVDMQRRPCKIIRWPETKELSFPAFVGQSQGLLYCISGHKKIEDGRDYITGLSIWVLEDYGAEQWVQKQSVSCHQLFGEMSCGIDELDVVAVHPDRSLVFIVHGYNQKLISYDMDSMEVCSLQALGHGCRSVVPYVPHFEKLPTPVPRHIQDLFVKLESGDPSNLDEST